MNAVSSDCLEVPVPAETKQELTLYQQAMKHLLAGIPDTNMAKGIELLQQAWKEGDPNAGQALCQAYLDGDGVPRDYDQVRILAEKLIDMKYYPAYYFLSTLYANGYGVKLDKEKSAHYAAELERLCSVPIVGVDDMLRYEALMSMIANQETPDYRKLENYAREYLRISAYPQAQMWYALSLLRIYSALGDESPTLKQEILDAVSKGIQAGDREVYLMKSLLMRQTDIYGTDLEQEALKIDRYISKIEPEDGNTWLNILISTDSEQESEEAKQRFWEICNYGSSRKKRQNDLQCLISLLPSLSAGFWRVLPKAKAEEYHAQEKLTELFHQEDPFVVLENKSKKPLTDLKLRICCSDIDLDKTIDLPQVIEPDSSLTIPLAADHGIMMGNEVMIEVRAHDQYSTMHLSNYAGVSSFRHEVPSLIMWWERGTFGGHILMIHNVGEEPINGLEVSKLGREPEVNTKPFNLQPDQTISVGWYEFSDTASLNIGESFVVTSQNASPVIGTICEE